MEEDRLRQIYEILEKTYSELSAPVKRLASLIDLDPFKVLICALISTRTKDETTAKVCEKLLSVINTPQDILKLDETTAKVCEKLLSVINTPQDILKFSEEDLANLLYPVGFYREKAKRLRNLAKVLLENYKGLVPKSQDELLKLPGVGRKVANIVLSQAFNLPYIGVDTHVHRICNRLGLINTKKVEETEKVLHQIVPEDLRPKFNKLLVAFGQTICKPVKPKCEECPLNNLCSYVLNRRAVQQ